MLHKILPVKIPMTARTDKNAIVIEVKIFTLWTFDYAALIGLSTMSV
jgi:hypothetical protein